MDHLKEVLGFICRWYVLGLACACVPAVIWMGLLAGNADAQAGEPNLVMAGGIFRQGRDVELIGYYSPASLESNSQVMGGLAGQECSLAYASTPTVYQFVVNPAVGENVVFVRGLLYGPLAFCRANPHLLIVPEGKPAVLLDSRVCINASAGDRRLLKVMIDRLSGHAGMAMIHGGPALAAQKAQAQLRGGGFNLPFIWRSIENEDWLSSVSTACGTLAAKPQTVTIVTADAGLAETLSARGYPVEFIRPVGGAGSSAKGQNLRRWDGIEQYVNVAGRE